MTKPKDRRQFLKVGSLAAAAGFAGNAFAQDNNKLPSLPRDPDAPSPIGHATADPSVPTESDVPVEMDGFSRFKPTRGNDPESPFYLGKKMPGFRPASAGPVPFEAPDLEKLPWKMVNGAKEFHLVPMAVEREFLPGYKMNVYGYNGSMPGPTIEVTQGDRVRIVVTNELPEDTFTHWHGFELPIQYDGAATLTQNPIKPGKSMVYEFDVHEEGTFFYHSHVAMQEAFGSVGWFIVHPKKVYDPPVDRDFGLIFQNFFIEPTQTVADSWRMDWNWHTINGRSGPLTTPLVCKHGERVRVRLMNFAPMQHHPIHLHGHTYWETGHERCANAQQCLGASQYFTGRSGAGDQLRVHRQQSRRLDFSLSHGSPHDESHDASGRASNSPRRERRSLPTEHVHTTSSRLHAKRSRFRHTGLSSENAGDGTGHAANGSDLGSP